MGEILFLSTSFLKDPNSELEIPQDLWENVTTDAITRGKHALIIDPDKFRNTFLQGHPDWGNRELPEDHEYRILVTGPSMGEGSSRENAAEVIALNSFEMVFSPSFGPIFFNNLIHQGVIPHKDFNLLRKIMAGYHPDEYEKIKDLSYVQQRIIQYGGLPKYIQAIRQQREEYLPQDLIEIRKPFPQTSVEKVATQANHTFRYGLNNSQEVKNLQAGDSLIFRVNQIVAYDIFIAHMQRILTEEFRGQISFNPRNIFFFTDHFRDYPDPNAERAVQIVENFWGRFPASFRGDAGVYNKVLTREIPPGSIIGGLDSHSPELGIIPGSLVVPLGYTAGACALANEGLVPYTIPPTIRLQFEGEIPEYCDAKDLIWNLIGQEFSGSKGNGKMFEIGGNGYAQLEYPEASKLFNAVTEFGGIGAIGTELNPQVIAYLRKYGNNLTGCTDEDIENLIISIQPDLGSQYDEKIIVDMGIIKPVIVGPDSHKKVNKLTQFQDVAFDRVILNSCAGTSIQDLAILALILDGERSQIPVDIHLADPLVFKQARQLGLVERLIQSGVSIAEQISCGPCLGSGPAAVHNGERVLSTNNRPYRGRMGSPKAEVFASSAPVAALIARTGKSPTLKQIVSETPNILKAKEEIKNI